MTSFAKKGCLYTGLAVVTAPIWVPAAFVGYVGYKTAKFAFRHPKTSIATLTLSGALLYASSHSGKELRQSLQQTVVRVSDNVEREKSKALEERLEAVIADNQRTQGMYDGLRKAYETEKADHAKDREGYATLEEQLRQCSQAKETSERERQSCMTQIGDYLKSPPKAIIEAVREAATPQAPAPMIVAQAPQPRAPQQAPQRMTSANLIYTPRSPQRTMAQGDDTGYYVVRRGDTLSRIAQDVYGDMSLYPRIAQENGIGDPRLIRVGQVLTIHKSMCTQYGRQMLTGTE